MDTFNDVNSTVLPNMVNGANGTTLIFMCHVYVYVTKWLHAGKAVANNSMGSDIVTSMGNETFDFSYVDCETYHSRTKKDNETCYGNNENGENTTDTESEITHFLDCFLFKFMLGMGARGNCESRATTYDNDTDARNTTMTLFSKDYHFHSFMVDYVAGSDVCENTSLVTANETTVKDAILSESKCDWYHDTKLTDAEKICSYDRVPHENHTSISYHDCFWYRFIAELSARDICKRNTKTSQTNCRAYKFVMRSVIGGSISIAGIICNCITLHMFLRGIVKTPTTYQLQWLAAVDTVFLILYLIRHALYHMIHIFIPQGDNSDHVYWRLIYPYTLNKSVTNDASDTSFVF